MINKRRLGKTDLQVTEIGLGMWPMGGDEWGPTEDQQSLDTIDEALDLGVNFFDTADVYGKGHSEDLLARAMNGRRDQFIVASKIGWIGFDDARQRSAYDTVEALVSGVEKNLERLRTEYLDLIQCHINFHEPNMEIFIEGFEKLQTQGKVRGYGVSTGDFEYLQAFNANGGCATLQIDYSILNRIPEKEIFPYCQANDIGLIIRGPLAMGILTGKFDADSRFGEGDFRQRWHDEANEQLIYLDDLEKVERLKPLTNGRSLAQLALQFSIEHSAVTTTIPGAKTVEQLRQNLAAGDLGPLSAEDGHAIDAVTEPGEGRMIWPA